jgi:hypothetical protein
VRFALLLALLLWQAAPGPQPNSSSHPNFRYRRNIAVPSGPGPACAVIDPALFPHAGPSLRDLRLYDNQNAREVPYVITLSEPRQPDSDTAQVRNLGLRHRNLVFDVEMPRRPYTDVVLNLAGHNFLATATVSGTRDSSYANQTHLGDFTLFDLTSQHLSRSTTLPLQETDLPYLHIELVVAPVPATAPLPPQALLRMLQGVTVPPSREAQSLYTTAATSANIVQRNRQSIATFLLPERIPIERVSFDLAPAYKSNFSRDVHITDHPDSVPMGLSDQRNDTSKHANTTLKSSDSDIESADNLSETLAGTILRVHLTQAGREIRRQQLSVPATLGSNMQSPATVQVAVDNGDDPPLPITAIRLEMRQRKLCFDAQPTSPLTLFYGNPSLPVPQYDYSRLWTPSPTFHTAQIGPEQLNPAYRTPPDTRPFTERHPHLLWITLVVVLCLLATIAIRSSRTIHPS